MGFSIGRVPGLLRDLAVTATNALLSPASVHSIVYAETILNNHISMSTTQALAAYRHILRAANLAFRGLSPKRNQDDASTKRARRTANPPTTSQTSRELD